VPAARVLLAGGGHAHLEVLRRLAQRPKAAVSLVLVSPHRTVCYSGMVPGVVAGHYAATDIGIDLSALAALAGAAFVPARVARLDLPERCAVLEHGERVGFDILSLDVGSHSDAAVPGVVAHALAVRPLERFLAHWRAVADGPERLASVAVVGGGAAGVELLLAMQHGLALRHGAAVPRFTLLSALRSLLPQHAPAVGRRLERLFAARGVASRLGALVTGVTPDAVMTADGERIAADRVVWAAGANAAPWLATSGLDCDARGFVSVNDRLRSTSHPFVFAAGDCATLLDRPHEKSGVYAVRQGPVLAENLLRAVAARPLVRFQPPRRALALISTGGKEALLSFGPLAAHGRWIWRVKDRIDRAYVARYRVARAQPARAPSAD
jgi:selenide,water dikinase